MSKREFFIQNGERLSDDGMTPTTVIGASRIASIALLSPELIGAQHEITVHDVDGRKYPAPRGGLLGRLGYEVKHLDTPEDDQMVEVTPRMSAEHIAAFGTFVGSALLKTGLIDPGESGIWVNDFTGEEDTAVCVADPRPRRSLDDIIADMELAPERLEAQTERVSRMVPALTAATRQLPAA